MTATGERIRQALNHKHMSQVQLADQVGVHAVTVTRWLTGKNAIPPTRLRRIAEVLEVSVAYLEGHADASAGASGAGGEGDRAPRGVPWGLVQVMLQVEDRVTAWEFERLRASFESLEGREAAEVYSWSPGVWFDMLSQLRELGRAPTFRPPPAERSPRRPNTHSPSETDSQRGLGTRGRT